MKFNGRKAMGARHFSHTAIQVKLARMGRTRLAAKCAKLDPRFEKALADEGLAQEIEAWPAYWHPDPRSMTNLPFAPLP
jgi:hypothetical protein